MLLFRATIQNSDFGQSDPVELVIAAGGGGGSSSGGGPPSTDDFCTVAFYDWDDTLLGTRIVAKGGSLKGDSAETADQRSNTDQTCAPLPPEGNLLLDVDNDGEYDPEDGDIRNKEGYDFVGWVDYNTGYCTPNVLNTFDAQAHHDSTELILLNKITTSMTLKAAYDENQKIFMTDTNESTVMDRWYEISYDAFQPTEDYTSIYTTLHIKRSESTRRALNGKVYLTMVLQPLGAGQTFMSVEISNSDYVAYTLKMPWGADAVYDPFNAVGYYLTDESGNAISDGSKGIPSSEIVGY